MSEIIETYQQEQKQLGKPELPQMAFATVVSVNNDGLELQFDGEDEASTKRFPCNVGVSFEADQRVLLMKVNGSYVALCPVGLKGSGGGGGGGGASTWNELSGKPFSTIGDGLKVVNGVLTVDGGDPSGDFYEIGGTIYYDAGSNGATYRFFTADKTEILDHSVPGLANAVYYKVSGTFTKRRWCIYNQNLACPAKKWGGSGTVFGCTDSTGYTNTLKILNHYTDAEFSDSIWQWLKMLVDQKYGGFDDWYIPANGDEAAKLYETPMFSSPERYYTSNETSGSDANFAVLRTPAGYRNDYKTQAYKTCAIRAI